MAKHDTSRRIAAPFYPEMFARNGRFPHSPPWYRVAQGYNQIATRMRKFVFAKSQNLRFLQGFTATSGFCFPFYFRTGEMAEFFDVHLGLTAGAEGAPSSGSGVPAVEVALRRISTSGVVTKRFEFAPQNAGITVGPSEMARKTLRFTVLPNVEYDVLCRFTNGARIVYIAAHETLKTIADDVAWDVVTNPTQFVRGGPIERVAMVDLNRAARDLWRNNAAHIFSWAPNYALGDSVGDTALMPIITSTSFTPIMTATVFLNMIRRGTLARPDIPCRMAVRMNALEPPPGDVEVRMSGANGSNVGFTATLTMADPGSGPWPWYVADVVMPSVNTTWTLQADTNGIPTSFEGWSLFQVG